ncbi:threonine dehydratase [Zymobacter palmae]|uniref:L-serine ammonia-lyase n=1 Tax=Zymobacter palmae TaxID=33074 RepID=A0A348HER9_9GAMM|nr:threonine dehydratase [Zymobacter palmae]
MVRQQWHDVPVIAVETEGAASFSAALRAGKTVELEAINTVASSLGAKRVCEQALACARQHPITSVQVSKEGLCWALFFMDCRQTLRLLAMTPRRG